MCFPWGTHWSNSYLACNREVQSPMPLCKFVMGVWDDIGINCCRFGVNIKEPYDPYCRAFFMRQWGQHLKTWRHWVVVQLVKPSVNAWDVTVPKSNCSWSCDLLNQTLCYWTRSWFTTFFLLVSTHFLFFILRPELSNALILERSGVELHHCENLAGRAPASYTKAAHGEMSRC